MRRRSQQLQPVSFSEFQQKVALLQLARQYVEGEAPVEGSQDRAAQHGASEGGSGVAAATAAFHAAVRCNRKGTDHLKKQAHHQDVTPSAAEAPPTETDPEADAKAAAAKRALAAWRAALQQHPERCNLFEQMPPFASAAENLDYMNKAYGFFVSIMSAAVAAAPAADAPSLASAASPGLLRRLWRHQQEQPCCLFCGKRFRGIRAALQHMQNRRHFQLGWDEQQRDLLAKFYDYKKSYYELLERLPSKSVPSLTGPEVPTEAERKAAAAPASTDIDEDGSDWENCSSDEEDETDEQEKLEAMLRARVPVFVLLQAPAQSVPSYVNSSGVLLRKRQKLHVFVGHGGGVLQARERQRLLLPPKERRLLRHYQAEQQRKLQEQRMKVSVKANKLQRAMLRETKCFL
ncbi:hypothetical protein Emed_000880 [Eimeria media]